MKTALRTYHPVPSLQKTDGNAQDAPRIKNCLKAALLPAEAKLIPPSTPEEILEKRVSLPALCHYPVWQTINETVYPLCTQEKRSTAPYKCCQPRFCVGQPRCCKTLDSPQLNVKTSPDLMLHVNI